MPDIEALRRVKLTPPARPSDEVRRSEVIGRLDRAAGGLTVRPLPAIRWRPGA